MTMEEVKILIRSPSWSKKSHILTIGLSRMSKDGLNSVVWDVIERFILPSKII